MMKHLILFVAVAITAAACSTGDSQAPTEIIIMQPADSSAFLKEDIATVKTPPKAKRIKSKPKPTQIVKITDSTMGNYAHDSVTSKYVEKIE